MLAIKQAPTTVKFLGHPIRHFEQTSSIHELAVIRGKYQHGLRNAAEIKLVEDHYGVPFDRNNKDAVEFWSNFKVTLNHRVDALGSLDNAGDLLKVRMLQAKGKIAPSFDSIINKESFAGFYLADEAEQTKMSATLYENRDEAISALVLLKKTPKHCIAIAKYLLPSSMVVKDKDTAYVKIREYIEGKVVTSKKGAILEFQDALALDKDVLYTTVDFNEAFKRNIIRRNSSGKFYNPMTSTEYGRNGDEAIAFLNNPKNQDELGTGGKTDKTYAIRYQLKNS